MIKRPESDQPIPSHAKRVFKGVIFDVYQWQQKMFDGSYRTFEKLKRPDTVVIIPVLENKQILLVETIQPGKKSYFGNAAGRLDEGESVLEAAKRELLEETGLEAQKLELWLAFQPTSKIDWAIYIFIAKGCKSVSKITGDAGEKFKFKKVTFDELVDSVSKEQFDSPEVSMEILRAKLNSQRMKKLRKLFLE